MSRKLITAVCVQSQRLTLAMTMNLSDYGQQTVPAAPAPSDASISRRCWSRR